MSVIGTGIAAGVANTANQAQQVARSRDKQRSADTDEARRLREIFETRLRTLEEGEQTPTQLRIDGEVPQHETGPQPTDQLDLTDPSQPQDTPQDPLPPATYPSQPPDTSLYRRHHSVDPIARHGHRSNQSVLPAHRPSGHRLLRP